jgi:glycosyltransferase involved in cell wall biosynthesis
MKKKVLICCNAYPPHFIGGAELVAHAQAKQLQNLGYDILVFAGDPSGLGLRHSTQRKDYEGVPVYRIFLTYEDYDYNFVNFTHKDTEEYFKKLLRKFSPDIVHFHNIIGLSAGLIHIAKQQGIRTVLTLHDHWGFCFKNTLIKNNNEICQDFTRCSECMPIIPGENSLNIPMRLRQDFIAMQLEEVDAFISPSQYLATMYIRAGIPEEKMHVIWNGVDVQKFANIKKIPEPSERIRFTFIGYFGKHKGIHVLLDALQYLQDQQNFRLNLIGSGDLFEQYKKEIAEKRLNEVVKFWGRIENVEMAYAETDVFILPSIWPENRPVTITEAMAAKIPIIAANSGGIPELVEDGKTGFLFEPGNASDLAKKMLAFIEQPNLIETLGDTGHERIETDTMQNQIVQVENIYKKILSFPRNDSNHKNYFLIACIGDHFSADTIEGMKLFSTHPKYENCRFVMYDWLQPDQEKDLHVGWVLDDSTSLMRVRAFLKCKIPLLVPQKNSALENLCRTAQCGLYYNNRFEIEACIDYLIHNENQRTLMGKNGFEYYSHTPL